MALMRVKTLQSLPASRRHEPQATYAEGKFSITGSINSLTGAWSMQRRLRQVILLDSTLFPASVQAGGCH